ncbi:MAG: hypothetical protein ACKOZY_00250 [Flavobacteriales bacterium]
MKTIITAILCAGVFQVCGQSTRSQFEIVFPKKSYRFPDEAITLWYTHTESMYTTDTIFIECYEPRRANDELTSFQYQRMEMLRKRIREEGCAAPVIMTNIQTYDKNREPESCFISYKEVKRRNIQLEEGPDDSETVLVDDRGWRVKCLRSQRAAAREIDIVQSASYQDIYNLNIYKEPEGMEYLQMISVANIQIPKAFENEPITLLIPTSFKRAEQLVYYQIIETPDGKVLCDETKAKLKKQDDTYFWVLPLDQSAKLCLSRKLISDQNITFQSPEGMIIQEAKMIIAGTNSFIAGRISDDQMTVSFPKSPLWKNADVSFVYKDLKGSEHSIASQPVSALLGKFQFNSTDAIPLSMNK